MANYSFSFQKAPRSTMNLELMDGTLLLLNVPSKKLVEKIMNLGRGEDAQFLHELDKLIADVLSNNQQGKKYTPEWVSKNLELEDQLLMLKAILNFLGAVSNDPN